MENIDILRNFVVSNGQRIPEWLDMRNQNHKHLWSLMTLQISIITKCIKPVFLSDRTIKGYADMSQDTNILINNTIENDIMGMSIGYYFENQLERITLEALELAEFETLANLKKFKNLFLV